MLLDNRRDRREMEIEELNDNVLRTVSASAGVPNFHNRTHCELSVDCPIRTPAIHSPREDSSLQLSGMALELIPMFVHASKEVGTPMYIKHYSFALLAPPFIKVSPHLDPLCLQDAVVSTPLPPFLASYSVNPMMS